MKTVSFKLIAFGMALLPFIASCSNNGGGGGGGSGSSSENAPAVQNTASIVLDSPVYSSEDIEIKSSASPVKQGSSCTFTVKEGYDSYTWILDGTLQSSADFSLTLTASDTGKLAVGPHTVLAVVPSDDDETLICGELTFVVID